VTWANIDKAKQLLGWEPTIGFQTGVERSVQWYIDNRDWLRSIKL